jgi:hypothetical protein
MSPIVVVQQLKDTFSIIHTNLHAWLNTVYCMWGQMTKVCNNVSQCKLGDECRSSSRNYSHYIEPKDTLPCS